MDVPLLTDRFNVAPVQDDISLNDKAEPLYMKSIEIRNQKY